MRFLRLYICVCVAVAALGVSALIAVEAHAQQYPYFDTTDPNVTVDLSVLGDGGYGVGVGGVPPSSFTGRALMVPGAKFPVSRLVGPSAGGGIKLKKPGAKPARRAVKPVKRVAKARRSAPVAPPPKRAPAKPKIVKAPVAPPPPMEKKSASAPKPMDIAKAPPAPPPPGVTGKASASKASADVPPPAPSGQQASLPPTGSPLTAGRVMRVLFGQDSAKMPPEAKDGLNQLVARMKGQEGIRLQLQAYAGGGGLSTSKARRLSLSRALSIRSYLIEVGVRSTRIDVRALGDKTSEQPFNRVDLSLVER